MSNDEQWGEWQIHDGKGCPCMGQYVHRVADQLGYNPNIGKWVSEVEGIVKSLGPWIWGTPGYVRIIRYRIRKPRSTAMDRLAEIAREPKAPITAPEGPVRTPEHIATAKRAEVEQH